MTRQSIFWRIAYMVAAFGIYMTDQTTKAWAVRALRFGDERTIIPNLLALVYAENPGIAFGQLQSEGSFGRWFFVVLGGAAMIAVLFYFWRTTRDSDRVLGACALLLAGIAGNLTDRARLGYVVDFILAHYHQYQWPVFNVADMSICAGAFLLACDIFFQSGVRSQESEVRS